MTHFRTSVTALETDAPQLCATQLVAHPGTLPTITLPMVGGRPADVDGAWHHLREAAEFFGIPMPGLRELAAAVATFGASVRELTAVTITIADGPTRIVTFGQAVTPMRSHAVRVAGEGSGPQAHRETDPWWRRMAARTTSRGELDQRERWLNADGYVDGLADGEPLLGALVFETAGKAVGLENPEPTSVLDQMAQCGAIVTIDRVTARPSEVDHVWWVSPRFETHPVAELDGTPFAVDLEAVPSFARWS